MAPIEGDTLNSRIVLFVICMVLVLFPGYRAQASTLYFFQNNANWVEILGNTSAETTQANAAPQIDQVCLALAIYHEARGEPYLGQFAVGKTVLNRVQSRAYPDTICEVVYQNAEQLNRCQFSFACDHTSDVPVQKNSFNKALLIASYLRERTTLPLESTSQDSLFIALNVSTHYHRVDVTPIWSKELNPLTRIGNHVFFESERVVRKYRPAVEIDPILVASVSYR